MNLVEPRRESLGYTAAPGLLLVSGIGGIAFAVAGALDEALNGHQTELVVILVHLVMSAVSFAFLADFIAPAKKPSPGQARGGST